jgi:hypothetical protein
MGIMLWEKLCVCGTPPTCLEQIHPINLIVPAEEVMFDNACTADMLKLKQ